MKKFSVAVLSVLTIVLGSFLAACNFKKPEVNFTQGEILFSEQQTINMNDFVEVTGVDKSQISYRFSNPSLFDCDGAQVTAKQGVFGKSLIYAIFENNSLASTRLVLKKKFDVPSNFSLDENALLTWDPVSGMFEDQAQEVFAAGYAIEGTFSSLQQEIATPICEIVSSNSFKLDKGNGIYKLKFTALGKGYFSDSASTVEMKFYVGYMPKLSVSDFSWNDGVLTWNSVAGAKYKLKFDGNVLESQEENLIDLSDRLTESSARSHVVSVIVSDTTSGEDKKFDMESEAVTITKLADPIIFLQNGQVVIQEQENCKFEVSLTSKNGEKTVLEKDAGATSFDGEIQAGIYDTTVVALGNNVENGTAGFFFHSNTYSLGKLFKLAAPKLSGLGDNQLDGTSFKLMAESEVASPTQTSLTVYGLGEVEILNGFSAGQKLSNFNLQIPEAGVLNVSAMQKATSQDYTVQGERVFVLNSEIGNGLSLTKLESFSSQVTHSYVTLGETEVSMLSFAKVANASKYAVALSGEGENFLQLDESLFSTEISDVVKLTFTDKIENLIDLTSGQLHVKLIAKTDDEKTEICSSTTKVLNVLSAPESASEMNSTQTTFSWSEVPEADKYVLEYVLTRADYVFSDIVETEVPEYTFSEVGYYSVKVYAISENENEYISCKQPLQYDFHISEQLQLGQVQFGFDENLVNPLTGVSGYFLEIFFSKNVTNYILVIDAGTENENVYNIEKTENGNKMIFDQISEDFENGLHSLSLAGHGIDDTLYLQTSAYQLSIERLSAIGEEDFNAGILKIDGFMPKQTVTVAAKEGVRNIIISGSTYKMDENGQLSPLEYSVSAEDDATLDIEWLAYNADGSLNLDDNPTDVIYNADLTFVLQGTSIMDSTHLFDAVGGKVYLDSTSRITFERVKAPTDLQYYDGQLTFTHSGNAANVKYYVLDILCNAEQPQKAESMPLSVRFGSTSGGREDDVYAFYANLPAVKLGVQKDFLTFSENTIGQVSIDLNKLMEILKASQLSSLLAQATSYGFSVYAYQTEYKNGKFMLSSDYAIAAADSTQTQVEVQKMPDVELSFDIQNSILSWTGINDSTATTYEVNRVGMEEKLDTVFGTTYKIESDGIGYSYFVQAKNPNYIGLATSNVVSIKKLSAVSSASLTEDGKIKFKIGNAELRYVSKVKFSIDDAQQDDIQLAQIANAVVSTQISGDGKYAFQLVGSQLTQQDGQKIYYLDSQVSSWNVVNMSKIDIANLEISIENNTISWNGLDVGATLNALEYQLSFLDSKENCVEYATTSTSVNWLDDEVLRTSLGKQLAEGDVTVGVSAHMKPHSVAANGTIFYAEETTLLGGTKQFNHLLYNTQQIKKLTAPKIESVEFINASYQEAENLTSFDAGVEYFELVEDFYIKTSYETPKAGKIYYVSPYTQSPSVKIVFTGNYGESGTFNLYVKGITDPIFADKQISLTDGKYTFSLSAEQYAGLVEAGQKLMFSLLAVNKGENSCAIPSSEGEFEITRPHDLRSVAFGNGTLGFTKEIQIAFNPEFADQLAGGINLEMEFTDESGVTTTIYKWFAVNVQDIDVPLSGIIKYDATKLFDTYLPNGGEVKIAAYINHSSNATAFLTSGVKESSSYKVLKSMKDNLVERQDYGFKFENNNGQGAVYVVSYDKTYYVSSSTDFVFVVPHEWSNGVYALKVYATQEGFICSAVSEISFDLSRIDSVGRVSLTREGNSPATISWNQVDGADGYILKAYTRTYDSLHGNEKGELLYSTTLANTTYSLNEIFGSDYSNLTSTGILTVADLMDENQDCKIWIEIITKGGDSKNNSKPENVFATIKSNPTTIANITEDQFGNIVFDRIEGLTYLYKLSTSTDSSGWMKIEPMDTNILDTSALVSDGLFDVEIAVMGSLTAETDESAFMLDSLIFKYSDHNALASYKTLNKTSAISSIEADANGEGGIIFTLAYGEEEFDCLFVGFAASDLMNGNALAINPTYVGRGTQNTEFVYTYALADLIEKCSGNESGQIQLYFWVYQAEKDDSYYAHSDEYVYQLNLQTDPGFQGVVKGKYFDKEKTYYILDEANSVEGNLVYEQLPSDAIPVSGMTYYVYNSDTNTYTKVEYESLRGDFATSYVVFENNDTQANDTLGIYVKISHENLENPITKFVTKSQLLANSERFSDFAINISEMIENDESLCSLFGDFNISFARASLAGQTYTLSNWKSVKFYKLQSVAAFGLSYGNLSWLSGDGKETDYYVYFYTDIENQLYSYFSTKNRSFDASAFAGNNNLYYLAVQAVSENDLFALASSKVFKVDLESGQPQAVYKNQINSALKLENGKLTIDWTQGDLYQLIVSPTGSVAASARKLATSTFTSPFTFNLSDLLAGTVKLRMRFISLADNTTIGKTFDVNAMDLLASLIDFGTENGEDVLEKLTAFYRAESDSTYQTLINNFITAIQNSSFGVANSKILFDEYFEALQTGKYRLEYCLVSSNSTLNSEWYAYSNEVGDNVIYVNEEPQVNVKIVSTMVGGQNLNQFKVVIKKSQVWNYVDGQYAKETATNYVVRLGGRAYSIFKDEDDSYKLMPYGNESLQQNFISVYECDSNGNVSDGVSFTDTSCLMFYLNYNNGNSFLGTFGNSIKGAQEMQVYALGNNISISSKSEYFSVTFLTIDGFSVSQGTFTWATYQGMSTTVLVKNSGSTTFDSIPIDGSYVTASFSLDGYTSGTYSLRFIIEGKQRTSKNLIFVDSDTYVVDKAYKLKAPSLSNTLGSIQIDATANSSGFANAYSDSGEFQYRIFNDNSGSALTKIISSEHLKLQYEAGVTGLDLNDPDYKYKNTESFAKEFNVMMLGSTATLKSEKQETEGYDQEYYLKSMSCIDTEGNVLVGKTIALRSIYSSLSARMLNKVSNVRLENGVLTWNEVLGKTDELTEQTTPVQEDAQIAYKVTITTYKKSNTENNQTNTDVQQARAYFTCNTHFDMALLNDAFADMDVFLKATVQAVALKVSPDMVYVDKVEFVEGGFGYGNVRFTDERFVLMSNGESLADIRRLDSVKALTVNEDGKLTWMFTPERSLNETEFRNKYDFIVTGKDNKQIKGTYTLSEANGSWICVFQEDAAEMEAGTFDVSVYAVPLQDNVIKSYPETLKNVTKLATITANDFEVRSVDLENGIEMLSLEEYFKTHPTNCVNATIFIGEKAENIVFTQDEFKIYILQDQSKADAIADELGFIKDSNGKVKYILVSGSDFIGLTMRAEQQQADVNLIIFSDESERFILQRTEWTGYAITWDEETQTFAWDYDLLSLNTSLTASKMRQACVLTVQTTLFTDEFLDESVGMLPSGTEVVVLNLGNKWAQIEHENHQYFISKNNYTHKFVEVVDNNQNVETSILDTSKLFRLVHQFVEAGKMWSIINVDGQLYKVESSAIESPIFIIEATYGQGYDKQIRTYTTRMKSFQPTISGQVQIKVHIKINDSNLLSEKCESTTEIFNLFASGNGTSINPYLIDNVVDESGMLVQTAENVFKNIAHRMSKQKFLSISFEDDENVFFFKLNSNLNLDVFAGFLFEGDFDGVIDGNGHSISYTSSGVSEFSVVGNDESKKRYTVNKTDSVFIYDNKDNTLITYVAGSALFESFTPNAEVSNLELNVAYGVRTSDTIFTQISYNSLVSGLVIKNSGKIENVHLTSFANWFCGDLSPRAAMAYSGIAALNTSEASITDCRVSSNMIINDNSSSQIISVAAICYTNFGLIEGCVSGEAGKKLSVICQYSDGFVQASGICSTNTSSGRLESCINNFNVEVEASSSKNTTCYMAGVVVLGKGVLTKNENKGELYSININATKGDIWAKQSV